MTSPVEIQSAAARAVAPAGRSSLADKGPRPLERPRTGHAPRAAVRSGRLAVARGTLIRALERQAIAPGELDAPTAEGSAPADAALSSAP